MAENFSVFDEIGRVNVTDTTNNGGGNGQYASRIVATPTGGFFIAWEDDTRDLSAGLEPNDIGGRRFLSDGDGGTEINVSTAYFDYHQQAIALAVNAAGIVFGAYQTEGDPAIGDGENIDVAVIDANGQWSDNEDYRQNTNTAIDDTNPSIAAFASGYVLAYERDDGAGKNLAFHVRTATFNLADPKPDLQFASEAAGNQLAPQVAILTYHASDPSFVITYEDDASGAIRAFRNTASGDTTLTLSTGNSNSDADVAALEGGGFVAAWQDGNGDGTGNAGIRFRIVKADGTLGATGSVNATTAGTQQGAVVAALEGGEFAIAWQDDQAGVVRLQAFTSSGLKMGSEFEVPLPSGVAGGSQMSEPYIAMLTGGKLAVSFTVDQTGNRDVHAVILDTPDNQAPTVLLSNSTIAENSAKGTTVGALSVVDPEGGAVTFELIYSEGGRVILEGNEVRLAGVVNFEWDPEYLFTVRATDADGMETEAEFVLNVTNVNEAPTITELRRSLFDGDEPGKIVAVGVKDPDRWDTFTYEVTHDPTGMFHFVGSELRTRKAADFETHKSHAVTVKVTDAGGLSATRTTIIQVTDKVDTVNGTSGNDRLVGASGADDVRGFGGDDILFGRGGKDRLTGDAGNDRLIGGAGGDQLFGGKGNDTASYEDASAKVTANLAKTAKNKGDAAGDTYSSIANLTGSDFGDSLKGDDAANAIRGGSGDDLVRGGKGDDTLDGGKGSDTIEGGKGADLLIGGSGADKFLFTTLGDSTPGGKGRDLIVGFIAGQGDEIDLSLIDANQNTRRDERFAFIGREDFSGKKGELRFDGGSKATYVYGDVNGDRVADFAVKLEGKFDLKATDFVL